MVEEGRSLEFFLHAPQHVKVRNARLHHDHIRAFLQVIADFPEGFVAVCRILLVDVLVRAAEVRGGTHGVAERAVVRGGVLRGVSHDPGVDQVLFLKGAADRADTAVHHVRRGNHVSARAGLAEGLQHELLHGLIIHDEARVVDQAVLAVRRVGVERDVSHDAELRELLLHRLDRAGNETVRVVGFATVRRLQFLFNMREERDHRHAEINALLADFEQFIDRKTGNARHRRDGVAAVFALLDKNRQDQIVRRKRRFTDESAGKAVMTVAAHAHHRKLTKSLHRIASKVLKQERPGAGCAAMDASIGISRKDQRPSHPSRVARSSSTPVFFSPEKYCTETGFTQVSARFFTAAITSRRSETVLN